VFEYHLKPGEKISTAEEEIQETRWMTVDDIKNQWPMVIFFGMRDPYKPSELYTIKKYTNLSVHYHPK